MARTLTLKRGARCMFMTLKDGQVSRNVAVSILSVWLLSMNVIGLTDFTDHVPPQDRAAEYADVASAGQAVDRASGFDGRIGLTEY